MPRPNNDRVRISFWIGRRGHESLAAEAVKQKLSISELYREVVRIGWKHYSRGERS